MQERKVYDDTISLKKWRNSVEGGGGERGMEIRDGKVQGRKGQAGATGPFTKLALLFFHQDRSNGVFFGQGTRGEVGICQEPSVGII